MFKEGTLNVLRRMCLNDVLLNHDNWDNNYTTSVFSSFTLS